MYIYIYIYIYICNKGGRNKCFKYNTTQNDRGALYLLFIYISKQKTHTLKLHVSRYNQN